MVTQVFIQIVISLGLLSSIEEDDNPGRLSFSLQIILMLDINPFLSAATIAAVIRSSVKGLSIAVF